MITRSALLMSAALLLSACGSDEPTGIEVAAVSAKTVSEVVEAPATVAAKASAEVKAPATGTVGDLLVRDGEKVKSGQVLMRISSPDAQQRLAQAREADRSAAGSQVEVPAADLSTEQRRLDAAAEDSFRTARETAKRLPLAEDRRDALASVAQSEAAYRSAQAAAAETLRGFTTGVRSLGESVSALTRAQRVQTQAAVTAAERTVRALEVRAPIAGTVTLAAASTGGPAGADPLAQIPEQFRGQAEQLLGDAGGAASGGSAGNSRVTIGSPVSNGSALLTVTDLSELTLVAEVDETDVLLVRPGVDADVELDAVPGAAYTATVTSVDVSGSGGSGGGSVTFPVRLRLGTGTLDGEAAPAPRPGMSAVAELKVRTAKDAVAVPSSAVFRDGERDAVWVAEGDRARKRVVRLGAQGADVVQVLDGVALDERIVVRGADRVTEDALLP